MASEQRHLNSLWDFIGSDRLTHPSLIKEETAFPSEHLLGRSWDANSEAFHNDLDLRSWVRLEGSWSGFGLCSSLDVKFIMCTDHPGARYTFETNSLLGRRPCVPYSCHPLFVLPQIFRADCLSLWWWCLTLDIFLKHSVFSTSVKWGWFNLSLLYCLEDCVWITVWIMPSTW